MCFIAYVCHVVFFLWLFLCLRVSTCCCLFVCFLFVFLFACVYCAVVAALGVYSVCLCSFVLLVAFVCVAVFCYWGVFLCDCSGLFCVACVCLLCVWFVVLCLLGLCIGVVFVFLYVCVLGMSFCGCLLFAVVA